MQKIVKKLKSNVFGELLIDLVTMPHAFYNFTINNPRYGSFLPKHIGSFSFFSLMLIVMCYSIIVGGHINDLAKVVFNPSEFKVKQIQLNGAKRTENHDVWRALSLKNGESIFDVDVEASRLRLLELSWIKSVGLQKKYPDKILVSLEEREPFAIWQYKGKNNVVDKHGLVMFPYNSAIVGKMDPLPLIVGDGANKNAFDLLTRLSEYKDFAKHIVAYNFIGQRRFDLLLDNGMLVKLPENNPMQVLEDSLLSEVGKKLLQSDITTIDLRIPNKIVVALSNKAFFERQKFIKDFNRKLAHKTASIKAGLL